MTALDFNNFLLHSITAFGENIRANCAKNHTFRQRLDLYQDYKGLRDRMIGFKKIVNKN